MALFDSFESFTNQIQFAFTRKGYFVDKCENLEGLDELRSRFISWAFDKINGLSVHNKENFLSTFHTHISPSQINEIRLHLYNLLNNETWARPTYFSFARSTVEAVVGNELVMQNRINVNIMMPGDAGSNQPLHIDAHSGESPFQCVLWIPLTDVHDSMGVFLLRPEANQEALKNFHQWMQEGGRERVLREIENELIWPEVPYGSFLLFSPNLIHGSVVNMTRKTRWSFNTRFKSLFSPYVSQEKGLGSFYLPIRTAPATQLGLHYAPPAGLGEP